MQREMKRYQECRALLSRLKSQSVLVTEKKERLYRFVFLVLSVRIGTRPVEMLSAMTSRKRIASRSTVALASLRFLEAALLLQIARAPELPK